MNEFGMYPYNTDAMRHWQAARENADARIHNEATRECCRLLISQHDPVFSLGIDRGALEILLHFVQHHDPSRLRRDCETYLAERERP